MHLLPKRVFLLSSINKMCHQNVEILHANQNTKIYLVHRISRNNSYYRHKYDNQLESLINKQIQSEHKAALSYLDMAVIFLHPKVSCLGAGGYFMKMYEEEIQHMIQFIKYQLIRGGMPHILNASPQKDMQLLDAFNQALVMEKKITEQLEGIVRTAETVKDYQCADFVTSRFLEEQMGSINEIAHRVSVVGKLSDNKHALYHYDQQLSKLHPYSLRY